MYNNSPSFWSKIKLFPHIIPIAFPLIFPIGIGLLGGLFHLLFPVILITLLALAGLFIYRLVTLGSADAAWNSIKGSGSQWQQRFTNQGQQTPYYQPSQPQQSTETPYYQPSQQAQQQSYNTGYRPETAYYQPSQPQQSTETPYYQPSQPQQQTQSPEQQ